MPAMEMAAYTVGTRRTGDELIYLAPPVGQFGRREIGVAWLARLAAPGCPIHATRRLKPPRNTNASRQRVKSIAVSRAEIQAFFRGFSRYTGVSSQ